MLDRAKRILDRNKRALDAVALVLREKAELEEQLREARAKTAIPAGAVVLQSDDAKLWEKVKAFGKPDAIEKALADYPGLVAFKTTAENTAQVNGVARAMGWNPEVLVDVTNARGLEYEDKPVTIREAATGKEEEKRVPHVRVRGAKDQKWERLDQFADRELKAYAGALKAGANGANGGSSSSVTVPVQPSHDQGSGGSDMTGKFIASMYGSGEKKEPAK